MKLLSGVSKPWRITSFALLSVLTLVLLLLVLTSALLSTRSGSSWLLSIATSQVNKLSGMALEVGAADGTLLRGLNLEQVRLEVAGTHITAQSLVAAWNPFSLLSGKLIVSELRSQGLSVTIAEAEPSAESDATPSQELISFSALPVGIEIAQLSLSDSRIIFGEQEFVVDQFALEATLSGTEVQMENIHIEAFSAVVDGNLTVQLRDFIPMSGSLQWRYTEVPVEQIELLAGVLEIEGDLEHLNINHRLNEPSNLNSVGYYESGLSDELPQKNRFDFMHTAQQVAIPVDAIAGAQLNQFSLHTAGDPTSIAVNLSTGFESDQYPAVNLSAQGNYQGSSFELEMFDLNTDTGNLTGLASIDWLDYLQLQIDYSLTEADPLSYLPNELPVTLVDLSSAGQIELVMPEGGLAVNATIQRIDGTINEYPITGQGDLGYSNDGLLIRELALSTAANQISLSGDYAENFNIIWNIDAPALDQLIIDATGSIVAEGRLQGTLENPDLFVDASIRELAYGPVSVQTVQLDIDSDNGTYAGALKVSGVSISSDSADQQVQSFAIDFDGTLQAHQIQTSLQSDYGSVQLNLSGGIADLQNPQWLGVLTQSRLEGMVGPWSTQDASEIIASAEIVSLGNTCFTQQQARLCIAVENETATGLKATGSLTDYPLSIINAPAPGQSPVLDIPGFQSLPEIVQLGGTVAADFALSMPTGGVLDLEFNLNSDRGSVAVSNSAVADDSEGLEELDTQEPDRYKFNWDSIAINGSSKAGAWQAMAAVNLAGPAVDATDITVDGLLEASVTLDPEQLLDGKLELTFSDLTWIEKFVPDLSETAGGLNGQLSLSGSLENPLFTGNIDFSGGAARVERLGVFLTDIEVNLLSTAADLVSLDLQASSDTGKLSIATQLTDPFSEQRKLTARVEGTDFELANIPDLKLALSPDVDLTVTSDAVRFDGSITVPTLTLQLNELPETAVDVSKDAVIVSYPENRPDLARSIAAEQASVFDIPILGEIDIMLGDQVSFNGFGMDARLEGNLNVRQQRNGSTLTYGELGVVEGGYELYGQRLELERGKLLFFGAYDNPALDIRAVRKIEASNITAGVQMNGTLKNISSQLFSTPVLSENDIIAVIVTGKPFSQAGEQDSNAILGAVAKLGLDKGQGLTNRLRDSLGLDTLGITNTGDISNSALTVGKYLTPEIFIRYGVGLFDNQSTVAVDYSVTDNVKLQAESGEFQSVDITYTIEQ